jgi:hypothetical protein
MTCFVEYWEGTSVMLLFYMGTTGIITLLFTYFSGNNVRCTLL